MSLSNSTNYVAKLNAAFYNMQSSLLKCELTVITYNTACIKRGIKILNKLIF